MTSQDMSQGGRTPPDPEYVALYRRLRAEGGVELREQLHDRYLQLQRGGVTPGGLPWPSPVDPVAEGADAIRALAEAVDVQLVDTGNVAIPLAAGLSGAAYYRVRRGVLYLFGAITGASIADGAVFNPFAGLVPVAARPPLFARYTGARFGANYVGVFGVTAGGSAELVQRTGVVQASAQFNLSYVAG